ncbi:energy transducer TonB [Nonlabens marinus]|uniref:Regulatory sensor-transducer, BlaR1/MecR1 family / TonB-dependent receptor n=1 Tax=Nonlabens marinus S1-08 TaxID=1454201 RepID=W8VZT7_9FLAO|nr:energy transducer TonB [Nonlabens marinus]BAO55146.1 regulatory sensor-transducer, BlaR1/MecR1 family / TonB-dependent receptor [Nonlabens marinus S1-08]
MRNLNFKSGAATSARDMRADKKSVNVKVNPFINFLLGIIAALLVAFVIIELQTPITESTYTATFKESMAMEVNMDRFTIEKPQPQKLVAKPKTKAPTAPVKKVDMNKAPVILDNQEPDPVDTEPATSIDQPVTSDPAASAPEKPSAPAQPVNYNLLAVSEVPLFPGCSESLDKDERISCLNEKMARYVQRKFDTALANEVQGKDLVTITVVFTIGTDGSPKDIQVRAPNAALEKEARRLISGLPKMKPGKYNGAAVNTTYALPIRFRIQ